ncbi:hypothetical protein J537_0039 [Acinetobacter baumannii 1437282]|nr:hypothetical protein J537_0039 [Acinetobacter baumannii 1437282]
MKPDLWLDSIHFFQISIQFVNHFDPACGANIQAQKKQALGLL